MKNNKYFILLIGYTRIQLFTEINGKITNINFSNGKNKLSNCVTFSYDREDLEFLPDGDPFEINQNSSFSDYLDFAGYHFESKEAIETIVAAIIDQKLIPNLGKNDDIFLYLQSFYFESKDFFTSKENRIQVTAFDAKNIKGHNVYPYDADSIYVSMLRLILSTTGSNVLIGYPFLTFLLAKVEDGFLSTTAPTLERSVVNKVMEKYPRPNYVPEKLLRNIENKILVSKLLDLPLPNIAIYQNRNVDIAKTSLSTRFDEILKEDARLFLEKIDEVEIGKTIIFDFGIHPVIKESLLQKINNPIFIDKKNNSIFTSFMLRNMLIQHQMNNDPLLKKEAIMISKNGVDTHYAKFGKVLYFESTFISSYIRHFNKKNVFNNVETNELAELCKAKKDAKN